MNEIDAVVQVLCDKMINIHASKQPQNNKDGDVGEVHSKYGIKQVLWKNGYRVASSGVKSFRIEKQYKGL